MDTAASLSTLGNIVRDTHCFIQDATVQPQSSTYLSSAIAQIRLPDPPSLYPSLVAIGAGENVAKEMDCAYNARALELRSYYENSITKAFAALADFPFPHGSEKRILDTFASLYLTKVKSWIQDGVTAYKNSRKPAKQATNNDEVSRQNNSRRAFNTGYVPFLEHFFDENQFPTHADKVFLAKKSGMTYRQIHVWFQNRRNRTKKPNETWRKKPAYEDATLPLDSLRKRMGKYTVHDEQASYPPLEASRLSHSNDRRSMQVARDPIHSKCLIFKDPQKHSSEAASYRMTPPAEDNNILDRCTAPLHAFPSPYPPVCAYQPFPLEPRSQMFSAFQWKRRANHNTSSQSPKIDINDLVERFALLSVRDTHVKRSQRNCGGMQDSLSATYSITITPPPAPHPALVKPTRVVSSLARRSPFPIIRASQPASHVFIKSTASFVPISPPSHSENGTSLRKVSPLPKRYPRQSPGPLPCRNVTPATSDVSSSTSSPCSSLRSLSDYFDFGREALSPMPCPGSLISHSLSPQLQTCLATQELPSGP